MMVYSTPASVECRSVSVPACEPDGDASQSASISALACFQIRKRDTVDFTVDWSDWLKANGNGQLSAATFVIATDSPKTPTISGQVFSPSGKCVAVLHPANDAMAGDAFYLDLSVTVAATVAALPSDVAIPARTLVRRIHVVVVNG